jgi:1,4-alpha-glucan branching enzyme
MNATSRKPASAYLTFTLHSHLPYVVNHGTWPHGMEWLHEAAAETYLPLLRAFRRLEKDGLALRANINFTPILLEQLAHPVFRKEFVAYVERKIAAAREDEAFFTQTNEPHFAETARFWQDYYQQALDDFNELGGDIVGGFKYFDEKGYIELITCGATHGYFPLLGTDESIYAQVELAVRTHKRHIGKQPRGIWVPEAGYRPAGVWQAPMPEAGSTEPWPPFYRHGVEEFLAFGNIDFFFVDTHLIEESTKFTPYELMAGEPHAMEELDKIEAGLPHRTFYQPYFVDGPDSRRHPVTAFPRDPRTGIQVWSGDAGYPGDGLYLDFHKKRWPGGHRYWQVTGSKVDMAFKTPYFPKDAAARTRGHAEHYVSLVYDALKAGFGDNKPPILCSPFDAELFGHWWFEGPLFLEQIVRVIAEGGADFPVQLTSGSEYLDKFGTAGFMSLPEGSWGKNGTNEVWLNPDTSWTWPHIYAAEHAVRDIATAGKWREGYPEGFDFASLSTPPPVIMTSKAFQKDLIAAEPVEENDAALVDGAARTAASASEAVTGEHPAVLAAEAGTTYGATARSGGTATAVAPVHQVPTKEQTDAAKKRLDGAEARALVAGVGTARSATTTESLGLRIVKQLCRELLLMESSDWQFLITTQAARDYAEERFVVHTDQFNQLLAIWKAFEANGSISEEQTKQLAYLEDRDSVFPDVDPSLWTKRFEG